MKTIRTLAAALAIAALAAPTALAKPISGPPDMQASRAIALAEARQARDPRSPHDGDAATRLQQPRHAAHPMPPQPAAATHDGGVDSSTIGLGIAGSVLALGGLALLAGRGRRLQRSTT
jgi:hypothetical protein